MAQADTFRLDQPTSGLTAALRRHWPLILGFGLMAALAVPLLAKDTWSHEQGAHGPLVIATAAWLLWRKLPEIKAAAIPGRLWVVCLGFLVSLCLYIFGEAFDSVTLGTAGLYGCGVSIFYAYFGARALAANWFIFFYLLFALPPPSIWIDQITAPLKQFVSSGATTLLQPFGIPVTHEGVVIYVAQYQLLVEDACSGLNSIIGLTAIGLFYIYLMRGSRPAYALLMACLMLPIAVISNICRIIMLILLTYFAGDDVAQGFLHFTAGILVFAVSLLLVFVLDSCFHRWPFVLRKASV